MKKNTKKRKFVAVLGISILLLVGLSLLLYFYTDYPQRFPKWFSTYIPILAGSVSVITILGTLLSDIIIPIWDKLTEQDATDISWLSNKAPIRKISYLDLIGRLGRGGKIPWVDRGILSRRALRIHGSVAIVGWMKSGKTREAAELIRTAVEMNLVSVIYEPTSALDLLDTNSLETAIRSEIDEHQKAIFFIDELGLRPEPERLSRLSTCINTIRKVRPDTFFLITIQRERLTSIFGSWLEEQNFHQVNLPPLTDNQREDLALTGASEFGVQLTQDAVDVLVEKTDGRPYSILFTLQQAQSSEQLDEEKINTMLEQTDEEAWGEQRRNIVISLPIAKYLLTSIVHFSSAGVTPLESSIQRYAKYLAQKDKGAKTSRRSFLQAQDKWTLFDIVASKGLYTIPEPLLLPLLIDVDDARARLSQFINNYNPGWGVTIIQAFLTLFGSLAQGQIKLSTGLKDFLKLLRKSITPPLSKFKFFLRMKNAFEKLLPNRTPKKRSFLLFRKINDKINNFLAPYYKKVGQFFSSLEYKIFLSWSVDKAYLLSELGSELQKREFFTSQILVNRGFQALDRGDFEVAIDNLTKAIILNERNSKAYRWRAFAYFRLHYYEETLEDYSRAIELEPDNVLMITSRGEIYMIMQLFEKALVAASHAIELKSDYVSAISLQGEIHQRTKHYEKALEYFCHAMELDPNDSRPVTFRGITYLEMNRYEEALEDINIGIKILPHDYIFYIRAQIYNLLGEKGRTEKDIAIAIEKAQKKYNQNPRDWQNSFNLALYYLAAGEIEKSNALYQSRIPDEISVFCISEAIYDLSIYLFFFQIMSLHEICTIF